MRVPPAACVWGLLMSATQGWGTAAACGRGVIVPDVRQEGRSWAPPAPPTDCPNLSTTHPLSHPPNFAWQATR